MSKSEARTAETAHAVSFRPTSEMVETGRNGGQAGDMTIRISRVRTSFVILISIFDIARHDVPKTSAANEVKHAAAIDVPS